MEVKKSPKANLEDKKGVYFELGLLAALCILFFAFEWKSDTSTIKETETTVQVAVEDEIIPVTQQQSAPPPPPPPAPKLTDLIDIVENDQDIDEELELLDAEDETENTVTTDYSEFGDYGAEDTGEYEIFTVVEKNPSFPGDLNKWLSQNLKFPQIASENGIQGRVIVQFVVEKDGSITDVKVARGVDPSLDKEAIRVVKAMPKWNPGMQRNKPVRVAYTLPVLFRLQQ
ncbi:energy transducer TonB [Porphyromonadaceae bacterium OttesenSCG-928-L07]|nr:energy transducer TonB [Porphyromonadaceae bacterium OttesenSCG-928-L07]